MKLLRIAYCSLLAAHCSLTCAQDSLDTYLHVLEKDPSNQEAHTRVALLARQMETERETIVRDRRLAILGDSAKRMDAYHLDPTPLTRAIHDTTDTEKRLREEHWGERIEAARGERLAGRLFAAHDMVLQVLAENVNFLAAQQELTELQSLVRQTLDQGNSLAILDRYALEGFYAYGQADYAAALASWGKLRTLAAQSYPGPAGERKLEDVRVIAYEQSAEKHVEEERRLAELKERFDQGVEHLERRRFVQALEEFRKVAIGDPEYPQLAYYLVQAESASERERAARLGEQKRQDIDHALHEGLAALERESFQEAQDQFEKILRLDASHPQALTYAAIAKVEMQKRHDPKAAQMHYEAGLVAYASGKLDEAAREWLITVRMNPGLEKAQNALAKVRKELALNREVPALYNETLP